MEFLPQPLVDFLARHQLDAVALGINGGLVTVAVQWIKQKLPVSITGYWVLGISGALALGLSYVSYEPAGWVSVALATVVTFLVAVGAKKSFDKLSKKDPTQPPSGAISDKRNPNA